MRRYPGTKPFTRDQASLFFGRAVDIKRLNELIALEPVVVVYGKSGYGKSSLINAGLLPQLEVNSDNICLMPRLNAWQDSDSISPLQKTRESIKQLSKDYSILDKVLEDDDSLWRKLKAFQIANPGKRLHLFFDQFEELFTYPAHQVEEFKIQLAELARRQVPRRYERALDIKGAVDNEVLAFEEEDLLYKRLNIRLVFIIRSDKMHLLDQLSEHIPRILKNNYEIRALTRPSAASALIEPALLKGPGYLTPEFEYEKSAQDKVLDFLEDDNTRLVEAIQLQILATSFEDQVHKHGYKVLNSDNIGDLESIVKNYYNDRLRSLGSTEEFTLASKMIEEGLVDKERHQRLTLHEGQIKSIYDVGEDLLNKLVENHLLRRQPDARSGYNYELSHDTLIAPVLAARSLREKKEAEEEYSRAQNELTKEKSRRRKATFIAVFAVLASLLAGFYAYKAYIQEKEILSQKEINEEQQKKNKIQQEINKEQKEDNDRIQLVLDQEKIKSDSLFLEAQDAELKAQQNRAAAVIALREARNAQDAAEEANRQFFNEVAKGKELEQVITGNDPYSIEFLTEEGDRLLANYSYQNALIYYATAKFILEPDSSNNRLTYDKLLERIRLSSLMSEVENLFKSGFFTLCKNKIGEIFNDSTFSEDMLDRVDPAVVNRETQMDSSEVEWLNAMEIAMSRYGSEQAIQDMKIGSPTRPSNFVSIPFLGIESLQKLKKLSIVTRRKELYLKSLPLSVDSIVVTHSGITNIPTIEYTNDNLSYLEIQNCKNLKAIGEEILNYNNLKQLIIKDNPNIERVSFDISDLDELAYLELADNPNLIFIPYFMSIAPHSPDLETLKLKNMELKEGSVIMGMSEFTEEHLANVEMGYYLGNLSQLKNLEIDNIFFDDLSEHEFDFIDFPNLEKLRLANLGNTSFIPSISSLTSLKELSIENLPIDNNLIEEISGLTGLTKLVLSDLNKLPEWGDLSSLNNLKHLTLRRIPNVSGISSIIKANPHLEYLEIDSINIDEGFSAAINTLDQLIVLKINNCNIDKLALNPIVLSNIEELELWRLDDLFTKDPWLDSIPKLTNLKRLAITTHYPGFIKELDNLEELDIEFSPAGMTRMPSNEIADIFNNKSKLKKLVIRNTYATDLPSSISQLDNLKQFFLIRTNISSLQTLVSLNNLEEIILYNNPQLRSIPRDFYKLEKLNNIFYFNTFLNTEIQRIKGNLGNTSLIKMASGLDLQAKLLNSRILE